MKRIGLIIVTAAILAGCKYMPKLDEVLPDKRTEYKRSTSLPDLEVPPDLSTEGISDKMGVPDEDGATFSTYEERVAARKKARTEEGLADNAVEALSGEKVLVVSGSSADVWDKLHAFWQEKGFELDLDDAEYGVQETKWREDKDNLIRDKYKIFAEPGEKSGTTTLYVSHEGEELRPEGEGLDWKKRTGSGARDQLVADLQAALGAEAAGTRRSTASASGDDSGGGEASGGGGMAEMVNSGDGKFLLSYPGSFAEAWSRTGEALSAAELQVTASDKEKGTYTINVQPPEGQKKGVLSRLAFWRSDKKEMQVSLTGVGEKTEIVVLDDDGEWDSSEQATQVLSEIRNQLNKGN